MCELYLDDDGQLKPLDDFISMFGDWEIKKESDEGIEPDKFHLKVSLDINIINKLISRLKSIVDNGKRGMGSDGVFSLLNQYARNDQWFHVLWFINRINIPKVVVSNDAPYDLKLSIDNISDRDEILLISECLRLFNDILGCHHASDKPISRVWIELAVTLYHFFYRDYHYILMRKQCQSKMAWPMGKISEDYLVKYGDYMNLQELYDNFCAKIKRALENSFSLRLVYRQERDVDRNDTDPLYGEFTDMVNSLFRDIVQFDSSTRFFYEQYLSPYFADLKTRLEETEGSMNKIYSSFSNFIDVISPHQLSSGQQLHLNSRINTIENSLMNMANSLHNY